MRLSLLLLTALCACKSQHQKNQEAFDAFCDAAPLKAEEFQARFEKLKITGPVGDEIARYFSRFNEVNPREAPGYIEAFVRGTAQTFELKPACRVASDFIRFTSAELLTLPGRPATPCARRVAQLRELGATELGVVPPYLLWKNAKPLRDKGVFLAFDARSNGRDVGAKVSGEQEKGKPITYLLISESAQVVEVLPPLQSRSRAEELRLVVWNETPVSAPLRPLAWAEATDRLQREREVFGAMDEVHNFTAIMRGDASFCPALAASVPEVGAFELTPAETLRHQNAAARSISYLGGRQERVDTYDVWVLEKLARALAHSLESCGCPDDYAEVAFARFVMLVDLSAGHAGWIPFTITDNAKAPVLSLDGAGSIYEWFADPRTRQAIGSPFRVDE